jgi:hypothetical protein
MHKFNFLKPAISNEIADAIISVGKTKFAKCAIKQIFS